MYNITINDYGHGFNFLQTMYVWLEVWDSHKEILKDSYDVQLRTNTMCSLRAIRGKWLGLE